MHHPLMTREGDNRVGIDGCKCIYFNFLSIGLSIIMEGERRQNERINIKTKTQEE